MLPVIEKTFQEKSNIENPPFFSFYENVTVWRTFCITEKAIEDAAISIRLTSFAKNMLRKNY